MAVGALEGMNLKALVFSVLTATETVTALKLM